MSKINTIEDVETLLKDRDVTENFLIHSKVSQSAQDYPCVLGIDEAGRGPVLGPMVYGAAFCPINQSITLTDMECADSKSLNEEKRREIFENMCKSFNVVGWIAEVISPNKISNGMLQRSKHSLNATSMDSAIGLIRKAIEIGVKISHIYVDTVGKPETYQAYLLNLFPNFEITVSKKADSIYPIVSAASICAKVIRDYTLQVWEFPEHGFECDGYGSGYPGDPTTKKFLATNCDSVFGYPQLVRFSWSTAETALDQLAYFTEWEDNEETKPTKTPITTFFKLAKPKTISRSKHEFFRQRHLTNTSAF